MFQESIAAAAFVLDLPYEHREQCLSAMPASVLDSTAEALSLADEGSGEVSSENALAFVEKLRGLREFLGNRLGNFDAVPTTFADKSTSPSSTDSKNPPEGIISLPVNALIDTKKLIDACRKHSEPQRKSDS